MTVNNFKKSQTQTFYILDIGCWHSH